MTSEVAQPTKRARQSAADMIRSLGLVGIIVGVSLIFVPGLLHPSKSQRYQAVDYSDYVSGFRQLTGKSALVPRGLPSGWAANGATLVGSATTAHLHIGWATPGSKYAGLEESVAPAAGFVQSVLGVPSSASTTAAVLADQTWRTTQSKVGEYSLFRTVHGITVVITGSASDQELDQLAASVQPALGGAG
ncbi:MAG TPA: DUF4245 domain-containing protein [Mycobacteriales bacterium]|nr:DUF4245 domain-containing protein [Mycobacteriales bacterium]